MSRPTSRETEAPMTEGSLRATTKVTDGCKPTSMAISMSLRVELGGVGIKLVSLHFGCALVRHFCSCELNGRVSPYKPREVEVVG